MSAISAVSHPIGSIEPRTSRFALSRPIGRALLILAGLALIFGGLVSGVFIHQTPARIHPRAFAIPLGLMVAGGYLIAAGIGGAWPAWRSYRS